MAGFQRKISFEGSKHKPKNIHRLKPIINMYHNAPSFIISHNLSSQFPYHFSSLSPWSCFSYWECFHAPFNFPLLPFSPFSMCSSEFAIISLSMSIFAMMKRFLFIFECCSYQKKKLLLHRFLDISLQFSFIVFPLCVAMITNLKANQLLTLTIAWQKLSFDLWEFFCWFY